MILAFDDCELDEALYVLRRGGRVVSVEPKVFDVLCFLAHRRARVVTKGELLDALWPGESVSESVLPRCVAAARRAVGDTRARGRIIQTVHGRGYRFVAPVTPAAHDVAPAETHGGIPFVGRDDVVDLIRASMDAAAEGSVRVVLLAGEPGIGKTRILEAVRRAATAAGARWIESRGYEGPGAPAFWPWIHVLRALVADVPSSAILTRLGPGAPEVAVLLPELHRRLRSPAAGNLASDAGRFRLFDGVTRVLEHLARQRPLVVAFDDLQWFDGDSLRLVDFVAHAQPQVPLVLLGAYRDADVRRDDPLGHVLGRLAGRTFVERVTLRGLGVDAVRRLVVAVAGERAAAASDTLATRAGGNPFFVLELARVLAEDADAGSARSLPDGIRDAVARRLARLSAACNETLRTAAVAGQTFELRLLEHLSDLPPATVLDAVVEATRAGLVTASSVPHGRYAFTHALLHQAVYDALPVPRRVALHARAADVLAALHTGRSDVPAATIAHHLVESAAGGDPTRAMAWCERAAEQALAVRAYAEAARHFARALDVMDHGAPDAPRRAALLTRLGEVRWAAGDRDGGRGHLAEAAAMARELGRPDLLGRAAVAYRGVGEMGMPPDQKTLALLEEAHALVPDEMAAVRARVAARLAGTPPHALSMATRAALATEAWTLAQRAGDHHALADAIGARYWAALGPDHVDERCALAAEARVLADRFADPELAVVAAEIALGAHLLRGDRVAADHELERYVHLADELRRPVFRMLASAALAGRAVGTGAFADAERHLADVQRHAAGSVPYADALCAGHRLWLQLQRGGTTTGEPDPAEVPAALAGLAGVRSYAAMLRVLPLLGTDDTLAIDAGVHEIMGYGVAGFERDEGWLTLMALLAVAVVRAGATGLAETLYRALAPLRHLVVTHDLLRSPACSAEFPLGLLALTLGRAPDAAAHFEAARRREQAMGLRPAFVRSSFALAGTLADIRAAGAVARAERLRAAARAEAERLGMRGVANRAKPS